MPPPSLFSADFKPEPYWWEDAPPPVDGETAQVQTTLSFQEYGADGEPLGDAAQFVRVENAKLTPVPPVPSTHDDGNGSP